MSIIPSIFMGDSSAWNAATDLTQNRPLQMMVATEKEILVTTHTSTADAFNFLTHYPSNSVVMVTICRNPKFIEEVQQ